MANPQRSAQKWVRNLSGATEDIRAGVEDVTESPMDKAADAAEKYVQRVQEAVNSGKFQQRLRNTPLSKWKDNTLNKGLQRIGSGAQAAQSDVEEFFEELFPYQERLSREVDQMSDVTLEDSIARMTAWTRGMAEFHRS